MKRKTVSLITLVALALFAVATTGPVSYAQEEEQPGNVLAELKANSRLTAFVDLVQAGALADDLEQGGPFTVFAPTDSAFDSFDADSVSPNLTEILLYHVVNGNYPTASVMDQEDLTTLTGDHVIVDASEDAIMLDGSATVVESIEASNGIIHVIDAVLAPQRDVPVTEADDDVTTAETDADAQEAEETAKTDEDETTTTTTTTPVATGSLSAALAADGRFDTLLSLLRDANLLDELEARDDFTLIAPTDDAFSQLSEEWLNKLMEEPEGELRQILMYHVVGDSLTINQIATDDLIPTLDGRPLFASIDEAVRVYLNDHQLTETKLTIDNGTIYTVDSVLIP